MKNKGGIMIDFENLRKIISIIVIGAFLVQSDILLHSQQEHEFEEKFNAVKEFYKKSINKKINYDESKNELENIIDSMKKSDSSWKEILGGCYLLLGAICEKQGEEKCAKENYSMAKQLGITKIDDIPEIDGEGSDDFKLYSKIVLGKETTSKTFEKVKVPGTKKKFPVLLVIGGVAVVVAAVMLLTKKKKSTTPSSTPEFVTNTDSLDVPEGGTAAFEVRLSAQPSSDVSVSVTRVSGDNDIDVQSGSSLTFTSANWDQDQRVTLAANEDLDTSDDSAAIRISAPGMQNKDLTATEQDNDSLSFETSTDSVTVNEGSTASFEVRLSHQPAADVQATASWVSGDTDITVQSGGNLTFTTSNWNIYQPVILQAAEDADATSGQAVIRITAAGIQYKDITAIEDDNDSGGCNISIAITSPANNDTVSGSITIRAAVTGNCVVDRVEFYIDGVLKGTDRSEPYSYDWDTVTAFEGPHTLRVVVYSTTGKNNDSQITVTVTR